MKHKCVINAGVLSALVLLASCGNSENDSKMADAQTTTNDTTHVVEMPRVNGELIFDGKTFAGWHGFNKTGPVKNWKIEDSALVCLGASKDAAGGDLVSDKEYGDFDLSWDWKVTAGGNSGMIYHVIESPKYKTTYETGPEYQMIDDTGFPEKLEDWQKSGSDYAMHLPNDKKKLKPVGEWNSSRIVVDRGHVEHWLNGEKILEFNIGDEDWNKKKAEGKWKDYPDYGTAKRGHLALQDHGHKVYFKNIRIAEL